MPRYRRVGDVPRKRHTVHRSVEGGRLAEELMGEAGFSQASSLLYHRDSPSALSGVEAYDGDPRELLPNRPLRPRHLRTGELPTGGDAVTGRRLLLGNTDLLISWIAADATSGLYRDALGDELVYVHRGRATLESVFGSLPVAQGDYVVIPASTTHRWVVDRNDPLTGLVIEASGHVSVPRRYLSDEGHFLEHAPYCERDIRAPEIPLIQEAEDVPVTVRTRDGITVMRHLCHPFDVVGWDGTLYPFALSIHDFEPIVGSLHQPPPVHQTFAGPNFVVCSFVPRLFDFHPDAVKIPYHHANVDSDEILFYSAGDFMSRAGAGIGVGSMTVHPAGFVHGPQPGSWERSVDRERTDELAVMIDTFRPLEFGAAAGPIEAEDYLASWSPGRG